MARKIFKRVGLRRDKNFGDLLDPVISLNNLLKELVQGTASSFISEDLDCIRNIFSEGIEAEGYQQFIGSATQTTNAIGSNVPITPSITYQNKLDYYETNSGEPRYNGGNGLTARYFNSDQIDVTDPDIFVGVTTLGNVPNDNFWEDGNFEWIGKFNNLSAAAGGGIEWEGYYMPTTTGVIRFICNSSISYTMEFEKEGYVVGTANTYTRHVAISTGGVFTGDQTASNDQIVLSASDIVQIGVGMTVSGVGINSATTDESVKVSSVNRVTNVVTLENPEGNDAILSDQTSNSITFHRGAGEIVSANFETHVLEEFRPYRIKLRTYVHPTVDPFAVERSTEWNRSFIGNIFGSNNSQDIRFTDLYSVDYDFSDDAKGFVNRFDDSSILSGGGSIGASSPASGYVRVTTPKKVDIKYVPKTSYTNIVRKIVDGSWVAANKIIEIDDTSNIEVGNYIFAATTALTGNINTPVRVEKIAINQYIVVDQALDTTSNNVQILVIEHRGFVKRVTGSGTGTITFSAGNDTNLRSNMIAIWNGASQYTGITTGTNSSQITISPSQTVGAGTTMYFYQSRGLIDRSLNSYCNLPTVKCFKVTAAASSGVTQLTVEDTTGIGNQWKLSGAPFADNTVTASPQSQTVLSFNNATVAAIAEGSVFTAVANSINDDRSLCCPPTDTSPPFDPTETGLETVSPNETNLELDGGNLITSAIIVVDTSNPVEAIVSGDTSNATVDINCNGTVFKILAKT